MIHNVMVLFKNANIFTILANNSITLPRQCSPRVLHSLVTPLVLSCFQLNINLYLKVLCWDSIAFRLSDKDNYSGTGPQTKLYFPQVPLICTQGVRVTF